ncbi:hypothetical protein CORC01_14497, partial [Colletotrichum orchidophilum]
HCLFCQNFYVTVVGIFHHLEQGACEKAPLTRLEVYQAVNQHDPNGNCFLCSGRFTSLKSLNQHLKSPKHRQNLYHCPKHGYPKEFSTLAAVTVHLQSGSCHFMTLETVPETAARIFNRGRMIAF